MLYGRFFVLLEGEPTISYCVLLDDIDDVLLAEGLDQIIKIHLFLLDWLHYCNLDAVELAGVGRTESLDYAVTADPALPIFGLLLLLGRIDHASSIAEPVLFCFVQFRHPEA